MDTLEIHADKLFLRPKARSIIVEHGQSFAEFESNMGKRDSYTGKQIFEWLGY